LLPNFDAGWVSVQDGAAQQVIELLDLHVGHVVLDACAAPGGKTAHMLEHQPEIDLLALDIESTRLQRVDDSLKRLGLTAKTLTADAASPEAWWHGNAFDRILIDAPCTGSGVIRRHPDIKFLRKPADIPSLAAQQAYLLDKLWPLLKRGGRMVYTTCSIFTAENAHQIEAFLARHPDASLIKADQPPGRETPFGYQRLPGDDAFDGFFYACLQRS
jgi:16S rRNA (cytosine967-C5)-methyltransferase